MAKPPVWLLDVDGVVNVSEPASGLLLGLRQGNATFDGLRFRMLWRPAVVRAVADTHESRLADVRWCSTWNGHTEQLERMWGLPRLACEPARVPPGAAGDAVKLEAASRILRAGHPLVWTDDTAVPTDADDLARLLAAGPACLIRVHPDEGLTDAELAQVHGFLVAQRAGHGGT